MDVIEILNNSDSDTEVEHPFSGHGAYAGGNTYEQFPETANNNIYDRVFFDNGYEPHARYVSPNDLYSSANVQYDQSFPHQLPQNDAWKDACFSPSFPDRHSSFPAMYDRSHSYSEPYQSICARKEAYSVQNAQASDACHFTVYNTVTNTVNVASNAPAAASVQYYSSRPTKLNKDTQTIVNAAYVSKNDQGTQTVGVANATSHKCVRRIECFECTLCSSLHRTFDETEQHVADHGKENHEQHATVMTSYSKAVDCRDCSVVLSRADAERCQPYIQQLHRKKPAMSVKRQAISKPSERSVNNIHKASGERPVAKTCYKNFNRPAPAVYKLTTGKRSPISLARWRRNRRRLARKCFCSTSGKSRCKMQYLCKLCRRMFTSYSALKMHVVVHVKKTERPCKACDGRKSKGALNAQRQCHNRLTCRKFMCSSSSCSSDAVGDLWIHFKRRHADIQWKSNNTNRVPVNRKIKRVTNVSPTSHFQGPTSPSGNSAERRKTSDVPVENPAYSSEQPPLLKRCDILNTRTCVSLSTRDHGKVPEHPPCLDKFSDSYADADAGQSLSAETSETSVPAVLAESGTVFNHIEATYGETDDVEAGDDEACDDELGDDEVGDDEACDDELGDDEKGDDEAGDDEAGDDEACDDKARDDEAGDDEAGDDEAGDDEAGDGKTGDAKAADVDAETNKAGRNRLSNASRDISSAAQDSPVVGEISIDIKLVSDRTSVSSTPLPANTSPNVVDQATEPMEAKSIKVEEKLFQCRMCGAAPMSMQLMCAHSLLHGMVRDRDGVRFAKNLADAPADIWNDCACYVCNDVTLWSLEEYQSHFLLEHATTLTYAEQEWDRPTNATSADHKRDVTVVKCTVCQFQCLRACQGLMEMHLLRHAHVYDSQSDNKVHVQHKVVSEQNKQSFFLKHASMKASKAMTGLTSSATKNLNRPIAQSQYRCSYLSMFRLGTTNTSDPPKFQRLAKTGFDFHCSVCKFQCKGVKEFETHVLRHMKAVGRCLECKDDGKKAAAHRCYEVICKACNTIFSNDEHNVLNNIYSHVVSSHLQLVPSVESDVHMAFECKVCDLKLRSNIDLLRHAFEHCNHYQSECNKCNGTWIFVPQNVSAHTNGTKHSCDVTVPIGSSPSINLSLIPFRCFACQTDFSDKRQFLAHYRSVHVKQLGVDRLRCKPCKTNFASEASRRLHDQSKHSNNSEHPPKKPSRKYICSLCGLEYSTKKGLGYHIEVKHEASKHLPCEFCARCYTSRLQLDRHIRHVHARHADQKCYQCGKVFANSHRLKVHIRDIHDAKLVKCPVCSKLFKQRYLKSHVDYAHNGTQARCNDCGKFLKNEFFLKIHISTQHGQMNIECDFCEMRFSQKHQLRRHMLTHGDEHPFQCEICGAKFIRRGCLNRHIKNIHEKSTKVVTQIKQPRESNIGWTPGKPHRKSSTGVTTQAKRPQTSQRRCRYK